MQIMLCAISNIASGNCSEDCKYCTQSAHVKTDIQKYRRKELSQIVLEAKMAKKNEALGFVWLQQDLGLMMKSLSMFVRLLRLCKEVPNLLLIACNGMASVEQLKELKKQEFFLIITILKLLRDFFHNLHHSYLGK